MARELRPRFLSTGALAACCLWAASCAAPGLTPRRTREAPAVPRVPRIGATPAPTPVPSYPQRRPVDEDLPLDVHSKALRYDRAAGETVFYGGVTATQDTTVLLSKELRSRDQGREARATGGVLVTDRSRRLAIRAGEADYTGSLGEARLLDGMRLVSVDPYGLPLTVTGRDGTYSDFSRTAHVGGGVRVVRGPLTARSRSATVIDGGALLKMVEEVRAALGVNRLQADEADFDQKAHWIDLIGDVRLRIIPSQVRAAAAQPWAISPTSKEAP